MSYATIQDIALRTGKTYTETEQAQLSAMLSDAAVLIDSYNANASEEVKCVVSCRMVIRAFGDPEEASFPLGASQGSMSAGGYTQSWTIGSGGSTGELYLAKADKALLGVGNRIGSYSPVQEMAVVLDD